MLVIYGDTVDKYLRDRLDEYQINPTLTLNTIAQELKSEFGVLSDRKKIKSIRDQWGYGPRPLEITQECNSLSMELASKGRKLSSSQKIDALLTSIGKNRKQVAQSYAEGSSLIDIKREYGLSQYQANTLLVQEGVTLREQKKNFKEIWKELQSIGWDKDTVASIYLGQNLTPEQTAQVIIERTAIEITPKQVTRLFSHLAIVKPKSLIKTIQGSKSREEKESNLKRLELVGFTPESLATYYESTHSVTYESLVRCLNEKLATVDKNASPFTVKWIYKTIKTVHPQKHLTRRSRTERNCEEFLRTLTDDLITSSKKLAYPYEIDFYIPSKNLAIEFNGDYWHSDKFLVMNHGKTAKEYHSLKKELCTQKGVSLYFVWEYDWTYRTRSTEAAIVKLIQGFRPPRMLTKLEPPGTPRRKLN